MLENIDDVLKIRCNNIVVIIKLWNLSTNILFNVVNNEYEFKSIIIEYFWIIMEYNVCNDILIMWLVSNVNIVNKCNCFLRIVFWVNNVPLSRPFSNNVLYWIDFVNAILNL